MPTTYEKANAEVLQLLADVIGQCHQDLEEVDANVCVLMATAAKDDKGKALAPAVKLHGVACAATVRIVSYKDRVAGREDAEILIDADLWEEASDPERVALLDHELHHLEVQRDDDGHPKSDDCGRPKLKMRHHDHDFGWFDAIARRHGDASYEVKQAKAFADQNGQLYWGWSSPPADGLESGLAAVSLTMVGPSGVETKSVTLTEKTFANAARLEKKLAAKPDDFADDGGVTSDGEPHVQHLGQYSRLTIEAGRYGNGQWAVRHAARIGDGRKLTHGSNDFAGRYATGAEALAAAADEIADWIQGLRATGKLNAKEQAGAREIWDELARSVPGHERDEAAIAAGA
jgi:hypothetical protein